MPVRELRPGRLYDVFVLEDHRGRVPVLELVEQAHQDERRRFAAGTKRMADYGPREMPTCDIADSHLGIWYFRATHHIRIWFIIEGRRIILLHAIRKTRRETDPHGLVRARALRAQYLSERVGI